MPGTEADVTSSTSGYKKRVDKLGRFGIVHPRKSRGYNYY